jgi:hypothetical protein
MQSVKVPPVSIQIRHGASDLIDHDHIPRFGGKTAKRWQRIGRGVSPGTHSNKNGQAPEGRQIPAEARTTAVDDRHLSPLRGLDSYIAGGPGAYAPGYKLSPLRGLVPWVARTHGSLGDPNVRTLRHSSEPYRPLAVTR